jgi:glycosyltransferase involved in cell wall biosynthesis
MSRDKVVQDYIVTKTSDSQVSVLGQAPFGTSLATDYPTQAPTRILAMWTRELDGTELFGRVNVALQVRAALEGIGSVTNDRLTNAFEDPSAVRSILFSSMALLAGLLSGRPLPLQCALFASAARRSASLADGCPTDVVYLDGIRTLLLMRRLRRRQPKLRIVVDLDDLMSRRYDFASRGGLPLSLGYLERLLPRALTRLAVAGKIARLVLWYECLALRNAERELLRLADSVVLLNRSEAAMLERAGSGLPAPPRAKVVAIPPFAKTVSPDRQSTFSSLAPSWRAIFVGSDVLVQNRMTIAYLLDLWSVFQIETPLHIYGRQKGRWPIVPNVTFSGYVADIEEAYRPGSIMVYPCLVPGGIKTKVLEAFAHGVPVVGNSATFEGILPIDYPLVIDEQADLVALLKAPAANVEDLERATSIASAYIAQEHSARLFAERWKRAIQNAAEID